jgi:hypothetical protein
MVQKDFPLLPFRKFFFRKRGLSFWELIRKGLVFGGRWFCGVVQPGRLDGGLVFETGRQHVYGLFEFSQVF